LNTLDKHNFDSFSYNRWIEIVLDSRMHYSIFELGVVFECGKINPKSVQIGLLMKVYLSSQFILDSCGKMAPLSKTI